MHDGIARPDDMGWPNDALAYLSTIKRSQEQLTHRAQLAEKILLQLCGSGSKWVSDTVLGAEFYQNVNAETAVKQADALIAALERK